MNQYPWGTDRPYNAYSNYTKAKFGSRVQKLSIDAGFSCPNRDGTLSFGGCTFCSNDAFNPSYCHRHQSIKEQIQEGIKFHQWRYRKVTKYLAYFQAYSNTYAPLDVLKARYEEALSCEGIIGLVIGTRPDCVDEKKLDYLQNLSKDCHIVVEYGIESCYDKTLLRVQRGHDFACTERAIKATHDRGLETGGHLIFGLPGESEEEMLQEAEIISSLPIDSMKFHQLQILDNTLMKKDYELHGENYRFFTFEQYKDFIIKFIERLSPRIVIERFASEVPPRYNVGPSWEGMRNEKVVELIENELVQRGSWQGKYYTGK